jgi:hypothetical protein
MIIGSCGSSGGRKAIVGWRTNLDRLRQIDSPNVAEKGQALRTREIFRCKGFAHEVVTAGTTHSFYLLCRASRPRAPVIEQCHVPRWRSITRMG